MQNQELSGGTQESAGGQPSRVSQTSSGTMGTIRLTPTSVRSPTLTHSNQWNNTHGAARLVVISLLGRKCLNITKMMSWRAQGQGQTLDYLCQHLPGGLLGSRPPDPTPKPTASESLGEESENREFNKAAPAPPLLLICTVKFAKGCPSV